LFGCFGKSLVALHIQAFQGWIVGFSSPGFTWGYSYSTLSGLGRWFFFPRFHLNAIKLRYNLLIFNHFLFVLGWGTWFFTFNKNNDLRPHPYINIRHDRAFFNKNIAFIKEFLNLMALRFHLGLFIFNPFRVGRWFFRPWVSPRANHIQPFQGWVVVLFTFNPFRVGPLVFLPQVSPGAIHIQPFQGWAVESCRVTWNEGALAFWLETK